MRGVWVSVLFVAATAAFATGCGGSGKELPKEVPQSTEKDAPTAVVVPAKSEPAAVAVVERAVKAATDNNPARIERGKVNRLKLKGFIVAPGRSFSSNRRVEAVWPDRLALTDEFSSDSGLPTTLVRLRRPLLWVGNVRDGKATTSEMPDVQEREAALSAEMIARHWMALLVPLADARTVVFAARKDVLNGTPVDVLRAAAPGTPVFSLWFDEKSSRLLQVSFAHVEPGNRSETQKVFVLLDHRAADGLLLPGRVTYWQNGRQVEDWTVEGWEFPERIDDAAFDAPK
ncbi:MAG TPA: hypothetical protein VD866_02960 [Urbifossiella sp.]|nr:hypothetical protein [Urbifossiella sp.]